MVDLNNPMIQKILRSKAIAHLATIGSDGAPESSPMWFLWDGEYIKFTHTSNRKKYQNIQRDPRVAISISDADEPITHAEFRGVVEKIEDDPDAAFFNTLAEHYGFPARNPGDPRVILYVKIQHIAGQNLASHHYTHIVIAQPDLNIYAAVGGIEELRKQPVQIVQEVKTGEALITIFKTARPLSAETIQDILHTPDVWNINANLDGTQPQPV